MREPLYTQSKNSCTITTIQNIWRAKYGIILNEEQRERMKADWKATWIWSDVTWAKFRFVYNWSTLWFYNEFGVEIWVDAVDILSDEFEVRSLRWEGWGIWLLYAWPWLHRVIEDQEITLEEIQNSNKEDEKFYWHNQFWKLDYIVWILRSIPYDKKFNKFKLGALKEAVRKWFYWKTARAFTINDKLLEYYLVELNRWTVFQKVEQLDPKNRKALDLALKLRIVKK